MTKAKSSKSPSLLSDSSLFRKDWHAVAGLCILVAIFFRNILLQNSFLWEDFLYYYYPVRNFAAISLVHGEIPLWNPYTFNGMPFQADIQTAIFYLPNFLLTFFAGSDRLHFFWFELEIILHYMLAAVTMYYLAKSFDLQKPIAFFSGLAFALSGFLITRAIHYPMVCETAWFPLIALLFRKTLLDKSLWWMVITGLVLGHTVLAGFPQTSLYIFYFLFVYFLFEWYQTVRAENLKASVPIIALAAGCVIISLAVAAVQLLPTVELAPYTQRAEMTYEKSIEGSLTWGGLIILLIPKFFGSNGAQGSTAWGNSFYGQYWETCIYLGVSTFACLLFAIPLLKRNRIAALLFSLFVFGVLYTLGDSFVIHRIFFNYIPGFHTFRDPGRMSFIVSFSGALLCGIGLQHFITAADEKKKIFRRWIGGFAGFGFILWIIANAGVFQPSNIPQLYQQIHPLVTTEATTTLVFILIVCAILWLFLLHKISATVMVVVLIVIQFIDMNIFGFNQNNSSVNPAEYYGRPSQLVNALKAEAKGEPFRINARQGGAMLLDRNQGMMDRIFMMEGYSSLVLQRINPPGKDWAAIRDLMNAKYHIVVDEQKQSMSMGKSSTYVPRAYLVHDVKVIKTDAEQKAFMASEAFQPLHSVVLEEDIPLLLNDTSQSQSPVVITSYQMNALLLDVTAAKDGCLCFSEVYFPGWNAYVDGVQRHVYRANWNQRAVILEAGHHTVEMRFEPKSFYQGAWISGATLALSLLIIVGQPRVFRKRSPVVHR